MSFWMKSIANCETSWWTASSLGGKKYPLACWWASMTNTPGYLTIASVKPSFSMFTRVPRSRLGSKPHAVVRVLRSRPSGLVAGTMNVVRFCSRRGVGAVHPRRHLVEQAHRRLARRRLVAVRGGRDPRERGPRADLREALLGRDVALAHARPERRRRCGRRRGWRCCPASRRPSTRPRARARCPTSSSRSPARAGCSAWRVDDRALVGLQVQRRPAGVRLPAPSAAPSTLVVLRDRRVVLQVRRAAGRVDVRVARSGAATNSAATSASAPRRRAMHHENLRVLS